MKILLLFAVLTCKKRRFSIGRNPNELRFIGDCAGRKFPFFPVLDREKKADLGGIIIKTGLTKKQKTTCIYFNEAEPIVEISTHNTALKNRLTAYSGKFPELCRQTDDDEHGGLTFEIDKHRFSVRLTAPYSEERKKSLTHGIIKN